ncbi:hypothetical protein TWF281_008702 [Arthrobotrys megalospora]
MTRTATSEFPIYGQASNEKKILRRAHDLGICSWLPNPALVEVLRLCTLRSLCAEGFVNEDQIDYGPVTDIVIANPPPQNIPNDVLREDICYPAIEEYAAYFKSKAIIFETGGDKQSERVKAMLGSRRRGTGTWKDFIQRNVVGWRNESGWD